MVVEVILHDDDFLDRLEAGDAVRWSGEAVDAHHRGELVAPPRAHADFGDAGLAFTAGRLRGSWFGYRSYDTFPSEPGAQVVVSTTRRRGGYGRSPSPSATSSALDAPGLSER